jgi:hypothetical protein
MKSHIVTFVIGFSTGIILYFFAGKTETIEKPIVTIDSNYYWINASQIDTLKHLRARTDSFQTVAKVVRWNEKTVWLRDTTYLKDDPSTGLKDLTLYNIYETDTVNVRGLDTMFQKTAFTMYPEPHFKHINTWNDDHILVKDKITTIVLPPKRKFVTHGFSVGPGVGVLTKQFDLFVGYTFTFNF